MSLFLEKHFVVLEYFPASLNSGEIVHYWTTVTLNSQNQD